MKCATHCVDIRCVGRTSTLSLTSSSAASTELHAELAITLGTSYGFPNDFVLPGSFQPACSHLLQEGGLLPEVLGHHVEAEEVAVDAHPGHGQAVQALVLLCCLLQQLQTLLSLRRFTWNTGYTEQGFEGGGIRHSSL